MDASKFLVAIVLVLATTDTMGQSTTSETQKIIATCGIPVALKVQQLAPKCTKDAAKSKKTCPSSCKKLIAAIPNSKCGAAVNAASDKKTQKKIDSVSKVS